MRIIFLTILLLFSIIPVVSYTGDGEPGIGLQTYDITVLTNGSYITLHIVSELANLSYARNWEVTVSVIGIGLAYKLSIIDSQNFINDSSYVVDSEVGIDTTVYGPFWVSPSPDPTVDTVWSLSLSSYLGNSIFIEAVMIWGYSNTPVERLIAPVANTEIPSGLVNARVVVFVGIAIVVAGKLTYGRAINDKLDDHNS